MPKLIIDHREIEVPPGTQVIDAAERLGIMIPRFCYHPALGSVGACRLCAVKFEAGPVKGVEMSCMVEAKDGMVVSTTDPEAVEFRRYVIEWLMLHHPHDCPVCDEGGHCLLQDETISGGHGLRRYLGKKRTYHDQYLGIFVQHEMNRCIHCWRCRRFYQEFAGYRDLGAMQIGNRTYFGRFTAGALESPFSGNLIDVCPTGVFTDKPARFKGRRWDFERAPSLCLHCSLGCNTVGSARYREMLRQEARFNEAVNGHFICDRGRFGFYYESHHQRPRRARVGGKGVPFFNAFQAAVRRLTQISQSKGPGAIACLGSTRSSLETQGELKRLCGRLGWPDPQFFLHPPLERKVMAAVSRLDARIAVSLRDIEEADFILAVGADPVNEAPMLAMALRQAYRQGATVAVLDPRPVFLPFEFEHLPLPPGHINLGLNVLLKGALAGAAAELPEAAAAVFYQALPGEYPLDPLLQERLKALGQRLKQSQRPVIICGTDIVWETTPALAADHALLLKAAGKQAGLFYLLPGANACGAALLAMGKGLRGGPGQTSALPSKTPFPSIIDAMETGKVKALLVVESDPFRLFPDQSRLAQALDRLDLLVVLDYLPSPAVKRAQIFLPTLTLFEREGSSYVNQEGRLQRAQPIHAGGSPISQISGGQHPPRTFLEDIPGGEGEPAAEILQDLAAFLSPGDAKETPPEDLWTWLAQENPVFKRVRSLADQPFGVRLIPDEALEPPFLLDATQLAGESVPEDHFELLLVDWTFGTEELSAYSRYIQQAEPAPQLLMHGKDVGRLGLDTGPGAKVALHLPGGTLTLALKAAANMAPGVLILPRHRLLAWQKLKDWPVLLPASALERV